MLQAKSNAIYETCLNKETSAPKVINFPENSHITITSIVLPREKATILNTKNAEQDVRETCNCLATQYHTTTLDQVL